MKIYISHASHFDYINKLYNPIKNSKLSEENTFFLPHEKNSKIENTKDLIANCDLVIAEISLPSTGQGIELAWAEEAGTPIVCIYEKDASISTSLQFITTKFIEYENVEDMMKKITEFIEI